MYECDFMWIDYRKIHMSEGANKLSSNMDEGNEVLVCASEYVKGMLIFIFEKLKIVC
jgi:hypothetical protein